MFRNIKLVFKYLRHVFAIDKSYFIISIITRVLTSVTPILMLNLPKMVIDEISGNGDFVKIIIYVSIMLVISLVSSLIVNMFVGEMLGNRAEYISQVVGIEIAMKHCELDMAQLDDPKVHDLRSLAGNVRGLSFGIINGILGVFSSGVMIVSTIVILWKSGWWVILVIFAMSLISVLTSDKIQDMEYKHTAETTRMFRYQYYYQGLFSDPLVQKDIRFFRIFSWIKEKYYAMFFKNLKSVKTLHAEEFKYTMPLSFFDIVEDYGLYIYFAWKAFTQSITVGQFTQYFTSVGVLQSSFTSVLNFFQSFNNQARYVNAYLEFISLESNIENQTGNDLITSVNSEMDVIDFKDVCFQYNKDAEFAIKNFNITFENSKIYTIVGSNGAGKTTFLNLISRLYDVSSGDIFYNGINVSKYNIDFYRKRFSSVFQNIHIFEMSIAENIALDAYDENDPAVEQRILLVLKQVGLDQYVRSLPKGIHTLLGKQFEEDGIILSGGQQQKIAIARALFKGAKIMLFDEPSSAMDPVAEDLFLQELQKYSKDRMIFYVSHRMTTAILADEVIYIENGEIVDHGNHFDMMKKCESYRNFYNSQAKYYSQVAEPSGI